MQLRGAESAGHSSRYCSKLKLVRHARTQALFRDEFVRDFQGIARPAKRRLEAINAAHRLGDLLVPPSNRLEKLKGNLKGFFSIRFNNQWRVIFRWVDGDAYEVRVVHYH